jgi:hypothetical protein
LEQIDEPIGALLETAEALVERDPHQSFVAQVVAELDEVDPGSDAFQAGHRAIDRRHDDIHNLTAVDPLEPISQPLHAKNPLVRTPGRPYSGGVTEMTQWEYKRSEFVLGAGAGSMENRLNVDGAEGWELVAVTWADRALANTLIATLKREVVPPPPPVQTTPDWYPDPCGRWEIRYWDGARWTAHVASRATKSKGIDPPQSLTASGDEQADQAPAT